MITSIGPRDAASLVCHFSTGDPAAFSASVRLVAERCVAVDLSSGCPQRVGNLGHYVSYLLEPADRDMLIRIGRAGDDENGFQRPNYDTEASRNCWTHQTTCPP
jgi:hypothetical protein